MSALVYVIDEMPGLFNSFITEVFLSHTYRFGA